MGRRSAGPICALVIAAFGLLGTGTALAAAPTATTGGSSSITDDGALLAGTVNPGGEATAYTFEYGTTLSFGNITDIVFVEAGSGDVSAGAAVTGLSPNTSYFFRLVATNGTGTSNGAVMAFTTTGPATPPSVTTGAASAIGAYGATLSGTVNPNGRQTAFTFEYGPTDTFGNITAVDNAGSAGVVQPVTLPVVGLAAETEYFYRLVATNTDGTTWGPILTFTTAADQAPTDLALSNSSVAENEPSGTAVGTLSTVDPDAGDSHTYTLVAGEGDADNASFQIDGGALETNAVFDFEAKSSYSIRVRTTGLGGANFEKQFTITITDVVENVAPTDITLNDAAVDENQPASTPVGTLAAVDPNASDTHTFSLVTGTGSTDNASFTISGNQLRTNAVFNFEAKSSYSVRVRATDQGNLFTEKQFTITITDVNEAPVTANDSYGGAIGNTRFVLGTASTGARVVGSGSLPNVNDTDPDAGNTVTCVAETVSSTGGGSATINANCSYTFTPGVGDKNQNDTFTYKATDGSLQSNGTVTVAITNNLVWYVDRDALVNGNGTSHSPLFNLTGVNGAGGAGDSDGAGDVIFLYDAAAAYTGGLPLEANQLLTGEPQGLTVNAVALVPAAGANPVIQNAAGTAIVLANGVTIRRINVGTSTGDGIAGTNITTADIGATSTITGVTGTDFKLSGAATGNITFGPAITNTAGRSVDIQNRSGGTVTLSGNISDTGTGVFLNSNTGATVFFTGDVDVSSGANPAFTATGGGTVRATGTGKTLATTTGTALNVANTTIGTGGLNFQSISANGAANGIILNNTGTTAGLTVAGTGAAPSGGTIQNTTGASAVSLTNTDHVSINNMAITGADHSGVLGQGVTNFSFTNGTLTDVGDTKSNPVDGAFNFASGPLVLTQNNVDGVVTITGNTILRSYGPSIDISQRAGTISDANISNNVITTASHSDNSKEEGISIFLLGSATTVANMTKGTFNNNTIENVPSGPGISFNGGNSTGDGIGEAAPAGTYGTPGSNTNFLTFSGNKIRGETGVNMNGAGIAVGASGRGQIKAVVTNNGTAGDPLRNVAGVGIGVGIAGNVTGDFTVTGNVLSTNSEFNSSGIGVGMDDNIQGDGSTLKNPLQNVTVSSNTISNSNGSGVRVLSGDSNGTLNIKLQSNTINQPTGVGTAAAGIRLENGSSGSPADNPTMCATVSGNTATSGLADGFGDRAPGFFLEKASDSATTYKFGLTGLAPSPATNAQTEAHIAANNVGSPGAGFYAGKTEAVVNFGSNFTSCTLPF